MAYTRSGPGCGYCAASRGAAISKKMAMAGKQTDLISGRIGGSSSNKEMKLTEIWEGWEDATKGISDSVQHERHLPSSGRQPGHDVARILVRRKNRIEDMLDLAVEDHK